MYSCVLASTYRTGRGLGGGEGVGGQGGGDIIKWKYKSRSHIEIIFINLFSL